MDNQTREKYRQRLLHEQRTLLDLKQAARESIQTVNLDQSSVGRLSRMDAMQSQAMAKENSRRREQQLVRIDAALERVEEGEYGYCASCDEEINSRRLDVDPANPFCVNCASKL